MRKIIVPVGYMESGSSAVTDLIKEYENVNNEYGYLEYVFLHCPNGLFDLEDKLLIGNNALRSDEAIHSFLSRMKELYNKKFWWVGNYKNVIGKDFYKESINFVNEITTLKLKNTYWYMQELPNLKMIFKLIGRKMIYLITLKNIKLKRPVRYKELYLSYPSKEEFYKSAKTYLNNIINIFDKSDKDLLLDQLLLPHNLHRIDNYFGDELKVIVVERDPRDVFISNKYICSLKNESAPYSFDVKEFCRHFRKLKETEIKSNNKKILRIHFEDLIYNYDETTKIIEKFLGFENRKHIYKKRYFDPSISIKNTKMYQKKEYAEEVNYIENNLKEFLYEISNSNSKIK